MLDDIVSFFEPVYGNLTILIGLLAIFLLIILLYFFKGLYMRSYKITIAESVRDIDLLVGPDRPEYPVVEILFGTDRNNTTENTGVVFGSERAKTLTVGSARVSIPRGHKIGDVERPSNVRFLWITLYKEKENPDKHFILQDLEVLTKERFDSAAKRSLLRSEKYKNQAFIFIHGFNVSFQNAIFRTAQMVWDLKFDGLPCVYSWPSRGDESGYSIDPTRYEYDENSAEQAAVHMGEFLDLICGIDGIEAVHLVAHSMGNHALFEALRDRGLKEDELARPPFNEIILAAPDIDRDVFEGVSDKITKFAEGVTMYASSNDQALKISKTFAGGIPRAGDVPDGRPLIVPGIDSIDASAVSNETFSSNHSYFANDRNIINDIGLLFKNGTRPPNIRNITLETVGEDFEVYWRFPQ